MDTQVKLSESALKAHNEALALIGRAHVWAEVLENLREDEAMDLETLEARRKLVNEMEVSYFRSLATVLTSGMGNGELVLSRDGEGCMFWHYAGGGICGGLVLHRNHRYSKPGEPVTVGTWSLHT